MQLPHAPNPTHGCCRLAVLLALLLVASCAAAQAIPARSPPVTLSRLTDETTGLDTGPAVEFLAAYRLKSPDPRFGGFSAIETDGRTLWLLSDRAVLWQASVSLDAQTGAMALGDWSADPLLPDAADRRPLDSEALARGPDGRLYVAFEHDASLRRLTRTAAGTWATTRLHEGRLIEVGPTNQGLESLARLSDGTFIALAEGAGPGPDLAEGARLTEAGIERLGYRTAPGFSPVGAAATAAHLYVLERRVGVLSGWQARLMRTPLPAPAVAGVLEGETLLRLDAGPLAENYEAVAVLERSGAPTLLLLAADDNQSPLQRNLLLLFRLVEPAQAG